MMSIIPRPCCFPESQTLMEKLVFTSLLAFVWRGKAAQVILGLLISFVLVVVNQAREEKPK